MQRNPHQPEFQRGTTTLKRLRSREHESNSTL